LRGIQKIFEWLWNEKRGHENDANESDNCTESGLSSVLTVKFWQF
jgi:hypothetical protein